MRMKLENFFEILEETINKTTTKKYILIVLGDWNAKIVPDAYDQWARTRSFHRDDIGSDHDMVLMTFRHKLQNNYN